MYVYIYVCTHTHTPHNLLVFHITKISFRWNEFNNDLLIFKAKYFRCYLRYFNYVRLAKQCTVLPYFPGNWDLQHEKSSKLPLTRGRRENAEVWCGVITGCLCREMRQVALMNCVIRSVFRSGPPGAQSETIDRLDRVICSFSVTCIYCYA